MFTIVTVYNKRDFLERVLLDSLQKQTAEFELIAIDNTTGKYKSAAAAFNAEVKNPKGDYILFVHQDVDFGNDTEWLKNAEREAQKIPEAGVMGVVGVDFNGKFRGYISDCGQKRWERETEAIEVQTVDELLFIIPKKVFSIFKFDEETFDGWHLYGADYCLTAQKNGLKTYVIPAFIYHRSFAANTKDLIRYKRRLFLKYRFPIFTSIGLINRSSFIKSFPRQLIEPIYNWMTPGWITLLQKETRGFESILDLGCGYNSPVQHLTIPRKVGVEAFPEYLEESRKKAIHSEYIAEDILTVAFLPRSFDIVFASEVIEHVGKEEGEELLDNMEKWAAKKVILTTPNGFLSQHGFDDNALQEHKSGWTVSDFKRRGFRVYGIGGFKFLRGPRGEFRYHRPFYFWLLVSALSQKLSYFFPSVAFQLFVVKDISI
ncbi:MAG: glycosyltransferase [Candidatus Paceibacteria bacterium]